MRRLSLYSSCLMLAFAAPVSGQATQGVSQPDQAMGQASRGEGPDAEAVAALRRMSGYLASLNSFELTSEATLDVVTFDDQRLQLDGRVHYKVKRPGIFMELTSDIKNRRYYYDGSKFTVHAPKLGFYATMPAPATNREFLKTLDEKFGIELPLEDLFRWSDGDDSDVRALTSGFSVGTATIDGVETDHWAFRQGDFDWEVWIEKGDRPLPRKLSIIDRTDKTMPGYTARLNWVVNPTFAASDFTFTPDASATQIQLATLVEEPR